jgi:anti-sigma factor RsiW
MSARDHASYQQDIGAYLLGALTDLERQAFERHVAGCAECRDELERLRPAADALPRAIQQVTPPPSLKTSLMQVVEREARTRPAPPVERRERRRLRMPSPAGLRPVFVGAALALGALAGFGVAQLTEGEPEEARTVVATVDDTRLPRASGRLQIPDGGEEGAILRVNGMPSPGANRVYQAWVQRDGMLIPQPTFEVGEDGGGAVAVPDDLSEAEAVLVTREPRGGSRAPSEQPVIQVPL